MGARKLFLEVDKLRAKQNGPSLSLHLAPVVYAYTPTNGKACRNIFSLLVLHNSHPRLFGYNLSRNHPRTILNGEDNVILQQF